MKHYLYFETADGGTSSAGRYPVDDLPAVIGRQADCSVQINLERISRCHAQLEEQGGRLILTDLDSTNGTFVNHKPISTPTPVRPGDTVHFAAHEFILREESSAAPAPRAEQAEARLEDRPTMMGFTAHRDTFPLMAPEFYDLLNERAVSGCRQTVFNANGVPHGMLLGGTGTHPKLTVPEADLFELAEALGEEARLAAIIRAICLEATAGKNPLQRRFIPLHAGELEDPESLKSGIAGLLELDPEVEVVACVFGSELEDWLDSDTVFSRLDGLCPAVTWKLSVSQHALLESCARFPDYVVLDGPALLQAIRSGESGVQRLLDNSDVRVVATGIEDGAVAPELHSAGIEFCAGSHYGPPEALTQP